MLHDDKTILCHTTVFRSPFFFLFLIYGTESVVTGWDRILLENGYGSALELFNDQLIIRAKRLGDPVTLSLTAMGGAAAYTGCRAAVSALFGYYVGLKRQKRVRQMDWIRANDAQQYFHLIAWFLVSFTYDEKRTDDKRIVKIDDFYIPNRPADGVVKDFRAKEAAKKKEVQTSNHKFMQYIKTKNAKGEKLTEIEEKVYDALVTLLARSSFAEEIIEHFLQDSALWIMDEDPQNKEQCICKLVQLDRALPHKQEWHDVDDIDILKVLLEYTNRIHNKIKRLTALHLLSDEKECMSDLGLMLWKDRKTYRFHASKVQDKQPNSTFKVEEGRVKMDHVEYDIQITATPKNEAPQGEPRDFVLTSRFSKLYPLHNELSDIHKQLYIEGNFPAFAGATFLGSVLEIRKRKLAIEALFNFVLNSDMLSKTWLFQEFIKKAKENIRVNGQ